MSNFYSRFFTWAVLFFVFVLTPSTSPSQQTTAPSPKPAAVVDVWPAGKMPGLAATDPEKDVIPAKPDGYHRITNISKPTLTFFPVANKNAPVVIVSPGGGYTYVVVDKEGAEVAEWLNSMGIAAFVLKYRTPKNRDGALQDIQRAVSLVRSRAAEWKGNPKQIGVIGFSAGGNLSAKVSNLFDTRSYEVIDKVDKQSSRPDFAMLIYPAYLETNGKVAADLNLKAKIPPTFIVTTEDDRISITGSKVYHAALDDAKIANELHVYPTGGHGYGLRSDKDVKAWPDAAAEWLTKIGVRKH